MVHPLSPLPCCPGPVALSFFTGLSLETPAHNGGDSFISTTGINVGLSAEEPPQYSQGEKYTCPFVFTGLGRVSQCIASIAMLYQGLRND